MNAALKKTDLLQYALLALPLAFIGMPLYIHAPDFYLTQTGLSLAAIGTALLLVRLFDAVLDPLIGALTDRYFHHRRAIAIAALGVLCAGFWMLFNPNQNIPLLWFCLSLILATTGFSVLSILLNAIGSLWSEDTHHKTQITTWREGLGLVGLMIAAILPTVLGFAALAFILPLTLLLCGYLFLRWQALQNFQTNKQAFSPSLRGTLHAPFGAFYALCALSMLASAIPAALVLFFIRDYLGAGALSGVFLLLYFLAGLLGLPVWRALAARIGMIQSLLAAMVLSVAMFIGAAALSPGDLIAYGVICVLSGFALGAELALPPAILSRLIDQHGQKAQTAFHFSLLAFLSKLSLAGGSGLALIFLGWSAFEPGKPNPAGALETLKYTYAVLPCALKLIAAALLYRFLNHTASGDLQCVPSFSPSSRGPL